MAVRFPKRVYSQSALECWFQRLDSDWECHFSPDILFQARQLYRSGEVRELELGPTDAIVYSRKKRQTVYALLEWDNGRPAIRTSTTDRTTGESLAVAGLYEIEELVADEVLPHPAGAGDDGADDAASAAEPGETEMDEAEAAPARQLLLRFSAAEQGLVLEAFWLETDGRRKPAFFHGKRHVNRLTAPEREKLIRLTGMAHKSGFEYWSHNHRYVLKHLPAIPAFVDDRLPEWEGRFPVEIDPSVEVLHRGIQTVKVNAELRSCNGSLEVWWGFRLGGNALEDAHASKLLRRGSDVALIPELGLLRIEEGKAEILESWRPVLRGRGGEGLPKYMLFSLFGAEDIPIELSPELEKWRDALFELPTGRNGVPSILRPYQKSGVGWLSHLCDCECHGLLADEMGLGKTLQVAALIATRPLENRSHLIVCPASVVPVWKSEFAKYFPEIKTEVLSSKNTFADCPEPVVWLSSYSQLRRQKSLLDGVEFGYAVLDEAQQIKNPEAKVSVACMSIRARHRIVLTGTPLENRHIDLWTLFRFLMPGLLGRRSHFIDGLEQQPEEFLARLRRQISPFVLRRTKDEVMRDLPRKVEMELLCPLTELQQREYSRLAESGIASLGEDVDTAIRDRRMGLFTLLTRLRQACCDPGLLPWSDAELSQSGKVNSLLEKVSEVLAGGHKAVIFSQFVSLLDRVRDGLQERFPGTPVDELTGKTLDRAKPVKEFQEGKGARIILVSLRAGGTGITLHSADYVFLLDPWWNPAVEQQAIDRVHRIGQDKTVFVYRLVTAGTIEERIERLKMGKRELFDQVVGGLRDVSEFGAYFQSLSELVSLSATSAET